MKTIKVSEATNIQLDYLVTQCEGITEIGAPDHIPFHIEWLAMHSAGDFNYTTDGNQMLPIWEREGICTRGVVGGFYAWYPQCPPKSHDARLLAAVARCFVASRLGETVEVPDELN